MKDLLTDLHVQYIKSLDDKQSELEYHMTAHLRLNGIYWGTTALVLLNHPDIPTSDIISRVLACRHPNGGFGGHVGHDPHLLNTLRFLELM